MINEINKKTSQYKLRDFEIFMKKRIINYSK